MRPWPHPTVARHHHEGRDEPVLLWRPASPVLAVSSAPLGGGIGVRRWVLNAQVPKGYDRTDPDVHLHAVAAGLGCRGPGVGLCTAAPVERVRRSADGGVVADATVGLSHPAWAAVLDDEPFCEDFLAARRSSQNEPGGPGTVNLVVWVPVRLGEAALVNAVATATEAKTQALLEAGVAGTGTASDAVCVCCPTGGPAEPYAGPRSRWGARIARAVHGAVAAGTADWLDRNGPL